MLNGTSKQAIAVKLQESPFLNLVSEGVIREALEMMRRPPDEPLTPTVAREVCRRVGAQVTLTGAVTAIGSAFSVVTSYYDLRGEFEKARPIYEVWKSTYPQDGGPSNALGFLYLRYGDLDRALSEFEHAARVAPNGLNYGNLVEIYAHVGRLADAKAAIDRWERTLGVSPSIHYPRVLLAFHDRDFAALERHASALPRNPEYDPDRVLAQAHAFFGRMSRARQYFAAAATRLRAAEYAQAAALLLLEEAQWDAEVGYCEHARSLVDRAWMLRKDPLTRFSASGVMAGCGDDSTATRLIEQVELRSEHARGDEPIAAAGHARIDLAQDRPARALERLAPFRSEDLASHLGYWVAGQTDGLLRVYLRGRAHLALGDARQAAAEFQKIIRYPGIAVFAPYHALAPLYLARAHGAAGDAPQSRAAYLQFFSLWSDADADIPLLPAARAEYASVALREP